MNKLFVVGIGPGEPSQLTLQAKASMEQSDLLCGYGIYLDLVRSQYPDKEYYSTPMGQEIQRCRFALSQAAAGKTVSLLCSGDPGVYAMAGPVLELWQGFPGVDIEIVPGITAALSGAALAGAPLMNDFCVLSLSDLLTPWETIERRLKAAAGGDFVVCIYNPGSRHRQNHLRRACRILMQAGKAPETVCAWVRNIGRPGTAYGLCTLAELEIITVDMFTTVYVGNSQTIACGGKMVTLRGYREGRA